MSSGVLRKMLADYFSIPMPEYRFCWQGGEPLLAGLDFFREVCSLQKEFSPPESFVRNVLQTNALLLDDSWGEFFAGHDFLLGVSIDGPEPLHDCWRGVGTHRAMLHGLDVLRLHGVSVNALTVVSRGNVSEPEQVYSELVARGFDYHQYLACLAPPGTSKPYSLKSGQWGEFLCRLFDVWYLHGRTSVSVGLFDSILSRLVSGRGTLCAMNGSCCNYLLIEQDGSVYPCDFYAGPEERLGGVSENRLDALFLSQKFTRFGERKRPSDPACAACEFLPLCMGDCPRNRTDGRSRLCADWRLFYSHAIGRFEELAARLHPIR